MKYKDLTVEKFRSLIAGKKLHLSVSKEGRGGEEHWTITGGNSDVAWWPWSRRKTAYNKGTRITYYFPSVEEVMLLTSHIPKKSSPLEAEPQIVDALDPHSSSLADACARPVRVRDLKCPECGGQMLLRVTKGKNRRFYSCERFPDCRGSHGCHPDGKPLGVPADQETKELRIRAHEVFDRLWKLEGKSRAKAYTWLSIALGIKRVNCHIGSFDKAMCNRVILACKGKEKPPQFRLVKENES